LTSQRPTGRVGVIGTGAMGGAVVQSLVRAGLSVVARDIRQDAQDAAIRHGATAAASPSELARACDLVIVLVVDDAVLVKRTQERARTR
jgi:3-hydroxyisobutyrate dehydrogenase